MLSGNFSLNEKIMDKFKTLYSSSYCEELDNGYSCNVQLMTLYSKKVVTIWKTSFNQIRLLSYRVESLNIWIIELPDRIQENDTKSYSRISGDVIDFIYYNVEIIVRI
jgi:hypothetical protein